MPGTRVGSLRGRFGCLVGFLLVVLVAVLVAFGCLGPGLDPCVVAVVAWLVFYLSSWLLF